MSKTFQEKDKVVVRGNTGRVVYVDEAYVEVEVNGVEMGFYHPFNAVEHFQEPPQEDDFSDVVVPNLIMTMALRQYMLARFAVESLGGTVDNWADLTKRQQLNYAAVAMGWKDADDAAAKIRNQEL